MEQPRVLEDENMSAKNTVNIEYDILAYFNFSSIRMPKKGHLGHVQYMMKIGYDILTYFNFSSIHMSTN